MRRRGVRAAWWLVAVVAVVAAGPRGRAAYPSFGGPAPAPEVLEVLERWVDALGGDRRIRTLWRAEVKSLVAVGSAKASASTMWLLPRGGYREDTPMAFGQVVSGYNGTVGWQLVSGRGMGVLPADEALAFSRECDLQLPLKVLRYFRECRRLPDAVEEGGTLRVLELKHERGETETWYFGETTGLRVRRERTKTDGVKTTVRYTDFRKVDGTVVPFHVKFAGPGGEVVVQVHTFSVNPKIDPAICEPPAKEWADYRKADDILQRHVAALNGGQGFAGAPQGRIVRSAVEIPTSGVKYQAKMWLDGAGRVLMDQDVPGFGRNLLGFDGRIGWAWNELQGYRELRGAELAQLRGAAEVRGPLASLERVPLRRLVGETEVGGRRLWGIELGSLPSREGVFYFDPDTGLLVRVESVMAAGAGGELRVVIELDDYRPVAGGLLPFQTTLTNPAVKIVTRIESIEVAEGLPVAFFEPRKDG